MKTLVRSVSVVFLLSIIPYPQPLAEASSPSAKLELPKGITAMSCKADREKPADWQKAIGDIGKQTGSGSGDTWYFFQQGKEPVPLALRAGEERGKRWFRRKEYNVEVFITEGMVVCVGKEVLKAPTGRKIDIVTPKDCKETPTRAGWSSAIGNIEKRGNNWVFLEQGKKPVRIVHGAGTLKGKARKAKPKENIEVFITEKNVVVCVREEKTP